MYFSYAFTALWYDRQCYLPGVLSVAFSAALIALQWGLLLGIFLFASLTVDRSQADVWVAGPNLQTADLAGPISERYLERLASQPNTGRRNRSCKAAT
jgi:putative ABC transport system permease protein